jgi:HK97 family phage major capsid protein
MKSKRAFTKDQAQDLIVDMVAEVSKEFSEKMSEAMSKLSEPRESFAQLVHPAVATEPKPEKGVSLARLVKCLTSSKGIVPLAVEYANKTYGSENIVTKALQASDATAGGFLVEGEMAREVIELLRAQSIVLSFGPRVVPLDNGSLNMPKLTTGASGSWIGEGTNFTHTAPVFGQVTLVAKKYGALVAISNDLLKFATPDTDALVRDDLVGDLSTAVDLAYIRGDGMAADPKGLKELAGNTVSANGTVNLANVTSDMGQIIRLLLDDDVNITNAGWMFAPRTWQYLFTVRDGNGNLAFKDELDANALFGFPWRFTSQIPINLGTGTNESEVYFVNFPDVVVGQASTLEIDASNTAAYHNGTSVVAAFSRDETVIRAIIQTDINVRHTESVGLISAVKWAA